MFWRFSSLALVAAPEMYMLETHATVQVLGKHVFADTVKVIPGSGHDVMLDWKWEEFATEIIKFVKAI